MNIAIENQNGQAVVKPQGKLTIYDVVSFQDKLKQALQDYAGVTLDLQAVEHMDTAALQVVWAGQKSAAKMGKPLTVHSLSSQITHLLDMIGGELSVEAETK